MGGFGSGRPGWKRKTYELLRLDVVSLQRDGALDAGRAGLLSWGCEKDGRSTISFQSMGDSLRLVLRVRIDGGEWEDVTQTVYLERTSCRFGGERPWFLCPGCGHRVGVLYGRRLFLCRVCHGLTYASQCEGEADRLLRRANKLRARLGGEPGIFAIICKPKRMRWTTFERMMDEIHSLEEASLAMAMVRFRVGC